MIVTGDGVSVEDDCDDIDNVMPLQDEGVTVS